MNARSDRRPDGAPRTVTVLGCSGSVGTQTIDLLLGAMREDRPLAPADADGSPRPVPERFQARHRFKVRALVAGRNAKLLAEQAIALRAEHAVVADPASLAVLRDALAGTGITYAAGPSAVVEAAERDADWTMAAITGAAGLASTLAAIRRGKAVALANKEALVCAGEVMLRAVAEAGATLLPVDSEHNAIFQSMADGNHGAIERIILTASGGPFRTATLEEMARATVETALRHPIWSMGAKISIDSATIMNKGLELIEAARLFNLDETKIDVLVHPQSVIHGMVCYHDGSVMAQLGSPDMRIPIAHTLAWPDRMATPSPRLDLAAVSRLEFEAPDLVRFPALRLARDALRAGGGTPAILNAANEVAVEAFLQRRIGFLDIVDTVERVLDALGTPAATTLEQVIALDQEARRSAATFATAKAA
jgi:1-deoxy-D-xylulose-5-phosphate reductoisomerase